MVARMSETRVRFGFKQASEIAFLYVIISMIGAVSIEKLMRHFLGTDAAQAMLTGLTIGFSLATALILWREKSRGRIGDWSSADWAFSSSVLCACVVTIAAMGIVLSEVDNWLRYFWPVPDSIRKVFESATNLGENPLLVVLGVVVIGPFCEEVVMRGVILRSLLRQMTPAKSILLSALLFSLMHMNPWQAVPTFFAGLLLGWMYFRTRSLAVCVAAHVANNAVASWSTLLAGWIPGFGHGPGSTEHHFQPWWFTALGAVFFVVGAALFVRLTPAEGARTVPAHVLGRAS